MRIEGALTDSATGAPIPDAVVHLLLGDQEMARLRTDENGGFEFVTNEDLRGAALVCTVERQGYRSQSTQAILQDATTTLRLAAEPARAESSRTSAREVTHRWKWLLGVGLGIAVLGLALLVALHPWVRNRMADTLRAGQSLLPRQFLLSANGRYQLVLQADGDFALLRLSDHAERWASGTQGQGVVRATMQSDGNLVLYDQNNRPVWASNTNYGLDSHLIMQDDGNAVVYAATWASGTNE